MSGMRKGLGERIESGDFDHLQLSSGGKMLLSLILAYTRSKEYLEKYFNLSSLILMKSNLISKNKRMWPFFTSVRLWRYDNVWVEEMDEEAERGTRCSLKNSYKDRSSSWGSLAGVFVQLSGIIRHDPSVCLQISTIIQTPHNTL